MVLSNDREHHYSLLSKRESMSDDTARDGDDDSMVGIRKSARSSWLKYLKYGVVQFGILAVYTAILLLAMNKSDLFCKTSSSAWKEDLLFTPMRDAFKYKAQQVDYNFNSTNPLKGQSVAQIDQEWDKLLNVPHDLLVTQSDLNRMNRTSIEIQDGKHNHIVQPVTYHMLHCLYNLYKYVHPDFYGEEPAGPDWVVTHSDHCIDNLRQFVQCHAGSGVSSFSWLDYRKIPWPVLTSQEVCIDWEHYDGWVRDHSLPMAQVVSLVGEQGQPIMVHPKFGALTPQDYVDADVKKNGHSKSETP